MSTRSSPFILGAASVAILAMVLTSAALAPAAWAQGDYPNRPIRLVVGFGAGSSADLSARILGSKIGQILGQQVVVEIKPGAGSSLAAAEVARAPKDGYTLFLASSANATNAAIQTNLTFDMQKDLAPIALTSITPVILAVHPSLNVSSVNELIALAKSKPGEINYASTGVGTSPHLSAELFNLRAGVKLVHVPYQGSAQAATDLLAGRTQVMFAPSSAVMGHVQAGKLKALASTAAKRPAVASDLPTMIEAGIPDFDTSIWFGLMTPAGTPRPIIDKLARTTDEALKSDEVKAGFKTQGFEITGGGPEAFARYLDKELGKWGAAAQAAGLKK